jgi:hypothetical protein
MPDILSSYPAQSPIIISYLQQLLMLRLGVWIRSRPRAAHQGLAMTNLLLTVLDKVGVAVDVIGDSTGRLSPDYLTAV